MRAGKPRLLELVRVRLRSASGDRAPCVAMQHYNNGEGGATLDGGVLGSGGGERDAAAVMRVYMYIIYVCVILLLCVCDDTAGRVVSVGNNTACRGGGRRSTSTPPGRSPRSSRHATTKPLTNENP